jgi:hypothetical protein
MTATVHTSPSNEKDTKHDSSAGYDGASDMGARPDVLETGVIDPVYQAKAHILNEALQEIGMGKYQVRHPYVVSYERKLMLYALLLQWFLFCVAGFGWYADNLWPVRL